jgi:hypothetical protein
MVMSAQVISLDAYRRKVAARLVRAREQDVCCYCGETCDMRERLASDRDRGNVAHFDCFLRESGMED